MWKPFMSDEDHENVDGAFQVAHQLEGLAYTFSAFTELTPPKAPNSRARVHRNVDNFFILIMFFVVVIFKVQRYYMLSQFIFKNVAQIV